MMTVTDENIRKCSKGSCQRHGRCMYLNHPQCPLHSASPTDNDVEREVRELAKLLYAHHVIKFDPEAEERCIKRTVAALQAIRGTDEGLRSALEGVEDRFRYAATMYHDATRWAGEDGPDGEQSLLDYVFAEVREALSNHQGNAR